MLLIRIIIPIALIFLSRFHGPDTWKTRLFNGYFCYYLQEINKRAFYCIAMEAD